MKKLFLFAVLAIVISLGVGVYYFASNINNIVKMAIEHFGSEAVKTSVEVAVVDIKLGEGAASINDLTIANPNGFSYPSAFSLGQISVDLNLENISQELIAIDAINITAPEIYYEINKDRKGNLNVLKESLSVGASQGQSNDSTEPSSNKDVNLSISKFVFKEAALKAKIVPLKDKLYDITLPPLVLNNLNGTPEQITRQVLNQLIDHAKREIKKQGLDKELAEMKAKAKQEIDSKKSELKDKADSRLDEKKSKAEDKLKNLLEK